MDLFSMGVIDDPDRPRQHRPAPVRCLERELLPPPPKVARCYNCHNHAIAGNTICTVCQRKGQLRDKTKRRARSANKDNQLRRFMRLRASMICAGGVMRENNNNARTLGEFVDAGNARWATARDLRRLGLNDNARVAILLGWSE